MISTPAPALLETMLGDDLAARIDIVHDESNIKRQRPLSASHTLSSPSTRKRQLTVSDLNGLPMNTGLTQAAEVLQKKPKQRRWITKKAPPRKWTAEEDKNLSDSVKTHGAKNWKHIAEFVPGRNHTQCLQRWGKVLAPNLKKGHWTAEEDQNLLHFVNELAQDSEVKNWGEVADNISGRTSKQCRERWFNHLDPSIKRGNYSREEDELIIEKQAEHGNRWAFIASLLPGRTEDAVKIRWKTLNRERNGKRSPKKPRKPRQPKVSGNQAENEQPLHDLYSTGLPPTTLPIAESVKLMMSGRSSINRGLKVQTTALANDPWNHQQFEGVKNAQPPTHPSWNSSGRTTTIKQEQQIGPHRYRSESIEWLEDALLSPMPNPSRAKSLLMQEQSAHDGHGIGSNYDKQTIGVLRHASELLGLSQSSQLTPPQSCHQAAQRALPSINPPNLNLKDEDLDHFLTDMDLENLGGALEHRLSFG